VFQTYRPLPLASLGPLQGVSLTFPESSAAGLPAAEVVLSDLEPAELTEEGSTPLGWLWDRPLLFVGLVVAATLGAPHLYRTVLE
jgi:hypothetical protein